MKILLIGKVSYEYSPEFQNTETGGVIFNMTKQLSSLITQKSISVIYPSTNDQTSQIIEKDIASIGVNYFKIPVSNHPESSKLTNNKLTLIDHLFFEELGKLKSELSNFDIIVSDLNFIDILKYLTEINPEAKLFIDATSVELAKNIEFLNLSNVIYKFNRQQVESLISRSIYEVDDCFNAKDILNKLNVKRALITLDKDGCFFFDDFNQGLIKAEVVTNKKYYNAGSAFFAGAIHAYTLSSDIEFMAKQGIEKSAKQIIKEIESNFAKSLKLDK